MDVILKAVAGLSATALASIGPHAVRAVGEQSRARPPVIATLGDLNGDGLADFVTCAVAPDPLLVDGGTVTVSTRSAKNGDVIKTITHHVPCSPTSALCVGRASSDSGVDFVVAYTGGTRHRTRVSRVIGTSVHTVQDHCECTARVELYTASSLAQRTIANRPDAGDRFGASMAYFGADQRGSGRWLLVGAPGDLNANPQRAGYVSLVSIDKALEVERLALPGEFNAAGAAFGAQVVVGNLGRSSGRRLVVAAPAIDGGRGAVLAFDSQFRLIWAQKGSAAEDGFGGCLASIGDVNDDGEEDYAAAATSKYVWILSGLDGSKIWAIESPWRGTRVDGFGSSVVALCGVDGRPSEVIAIGAHEFMADNDGYEVGLYSSVAGAKLGVRGTDEQCVVYGGYVPASGCYGGLLVLEPFSGTLRQFAGTDLKEVFAMKP